MPDAVHRYRLVPQALRAAQQRLLTRYQAPQLLLLVGAMLFGLFLATRHEPRLSFWLPYALILALYFTYVAFVSPRRMRSRTAETWQTYQLEIGPNYLLRTQADTPNLRLEFSEIRSIERLPGRFVRVVGAAPRQVIGIPEDIEGFPEILTTLTALHPITETRNDRSVKSFVLSLLVLVAFLAMAWARQPQIAIALAVLVSAAVLWLIVYIQRSPNTSHRVKRSSWWYLIIVGVCLLKILQILGRR
jgi:multisubunit Na+/H+ antiporter MnhB subunit